MSQKTWLGLASSRRIRFSLISIITVCLVFGLVYGQSGRKPPAPKPPPPSAPPADSDQSSQSSDSKPDKQRTPLVVTTYLPNVSSSSVYTNIVADGCLARLKQSVAFAVSRQREMNRKEASDLAKGSTDSYVLWFELRSDRGDPTMEDPRYAYDLYVNYAVFIPGTGKIKTAGHVYQRQVGAVGSPVPLPPTVGGGPIESQLEHAGRETADRVISALNIVAPR
jgi:hypothetical protein